MAFRLVVTGQRDGRSTFVSDVQQEAVVPRLLGGNEIFELWGADTLPALPSDGTPTQAEGFFPPAEGFRFTIWTIPPAGHEPEPIVDMDEAITECDRLVPGMTSAVTDAEGMHATDTVDCIYIIAGEVDLTLDGGETKRLRTGDCVVQNGTNHAWVNKGVERCVLLTAFFGALRQ
ncbi:MAG TPA: cupin domain-containing protein [Conexibacter sp.]|jgi:mannose-6-phosphate isomerase-like protein (cupin superfamily)